MTMTSDEVHEEPHVDNESKNGRQVGAENAEKLRDYLSELKAKGGRLPSRGGKPDKSAISIACGFNRQTLYNNPEAITLLGTAVEEIGLEGGANVIADGKAAHMQQQMDRRDRRIQQLEETLQARVAEIQGLKEQLRQYAVIEEVMSTNGRRFRP